MAPTLRIGLDAHMVGGRETGNETYVTGLLGGLSQLNNDFDVLVYNVVPRGMADGRPHLISRQLLSSSPWVRLSFDLPIRSWRDQIDVMHTTYTAPLWSRCPSVITVHDISFATNPEWFSSRDLRVLRRAVPWSLGRASRVITVSDVCRQQILQHYGLQDERVVRIYNGPGPAAERVGSAEARRVLAELGVDGSRRYILAVGNLQPRKNLVRLVQAFRQVAAEHPDVDLVIAGAKHYRGSEVLAAGGDVGERIRFLGYVTDQQLAACYELATLFVFPSLFEGFGIPAIEAMAHEVPVACARAGALPEVCGDAVIYFDPTDVASIAETTSKTLSDPSLRQRLITAGSQRSGMFSWTRAASETMAVYEQVAGR